MDWELFVGRFHPLIVHLPIGIFILGYFFEILFQLKYRNIVNSRKFIILTYSIGLVAGLIAALTGWLLSLSDDYGITPLNNHMYLGIATLGIMLVAIIYQVKAPEVQAKFKFLLSTMTILLIGLTGHLGGNLTHGSSYLVEYGPEFLKSEDYIGLKTIHEMNPDSVQIYAHIIQPLFKSNCIACHNKENYKGGLILERYNDLFMEADYNYPITAGNLSNSELFTRVSLPSDHEKRMPPRGAGLSYTNIQILKHWIENGADSLATFNPEVMNKELITLINRDYGLDFSPKPYYEKVKVDSLDDGIMAQLRKSGFRVNYLSETNFLLDVLFKNDSISKEQIELLNKASNQITVLQLSDCNLTDELLNSMAPMEHLTRIDINKNKLSESVTPFLIKHEHLEAANLSETSITNESLQNILSSNGSLRVYVRNTKITPEKVESLAQNYPKAEIISEFKFEKVEQAKSVFRQDLEN